MDQDAIMAEISAQSKVVEGIALNQAMVTEIDRHIKNEENKLNEELIHFTTKLMLRDFLPAIPINQLVTKVDENMWDSLCFIKSMKGKGTYEEISYEKSTKGFGFFYRTGEVEYDLGLQNGPVGIEFYYKILSDKRETVKVTGASVEIKLKAFKNLRPLLSMIANQANHVAASYYSEQGEVDGNKDITRMKVNLKEIGPMSQMEALRHLTRL